MSCHLFCICGTLFNAYDPTIEIGLITLPLEPDGSSSNLRRFPGARGSVLVLYGVSARGGSGFFYTRFSTDSGFLLVLQLERWF
jgi:hypothetical protein